MIFDTEYALSLLPDLLRGAGVTMAATLGGFAFASVLGLGLAVLGKTRRAVVRLVVQLAIDFVRGTPLLIQLFFVYYVLPLAGLTFDALPTGIVVLGLHYATYLAEVYRSGIDGIPRGQWEAALALNLDPRRTWTRIIIPQAVPPVIPALGNYLISMFKDTPVLSTITVSEMLRVAIIEGGRTFRYVEPITLVGLIFLLMSYPSSLLVRRLELRLARG